MADNPDPRANGLLMKAYRQLLGEEADELRYVACFYAIRFNSGKTGVVEWKGSPACVAKYKAYIDAENEKVYDITPWFLAADEKTARILAMEHFSGHGHQGPIKGVIKLDDREGPTPVGG